MSTEMKLLLLCCLFTISCTPTLYYPTMQNVPSFKHKGQYLANYGYSIYGNDFQLGYAVSDHMALLCNGGLYTSGGQDEKTSSGTKLRYPAPISGNILELGAGYFQQKSQFVYECYAFVGTGLLVNKESPIRDIPDYSQKLKSDLVRFSLQPIITYNCKSIDVSLSTRYSYVDYFSISNTLTSTSGAEAGTFISNHSGFHFLEPALTFRVGWNKLKFQMQAQRSILMNSVPSTNHYGYIPFAFSVGCILKI